MSIVCWPNNEIVAARLKWSFPDHGVLAVNDLDQLDFSQIDLVCLVFENLAAKEKFDFAKYCRQMLTAGVNRIVVLDSASGQNFRLDARWRDYLSKHRVSDYVVVPWNWEVLKGRWSKLLQPRTVTLDGNHVLKSGQIRLHLITLKVFVRDRSVQLSDREFRLLRYFLARPGVVLKPLDLAWQIGLSTNPFRKKSLAVYIHQLRKKIGVDFKLRSLTNQGYFYEENI